MNESALSSTDIILSIIHRYKRKGNFILFSIHINKKKSQTYLNHLALNTIISGESMPHSGYILQRCETENVKNAFKKNTRERIKEHMKMTILMSAFSKRHKFILFLIFCDLRKYSEKSIINDWFRLICSTGF